MVAVIVSPNLTVDRTVPVDLLVPGAVLRPGRAVVTAGCKGLNVGRSLAALGASGTLLGFLPRTDVQLVQRLFDPEPVPLVGVEVDGELRVATIYLEDSGRVTVLNEPGPQVNEADWQRLADAVDNQLGGHDHPLLVCSGSLPPGAPDDGYGRLTAIARRHGAPAVIDAARDVLISSLASEPDLVTPNLAEAEAALGWTTGEPVTDARTDVTDVAERAQVAVRAMCAAGARTAVVTAGSAGAAFGDRRDVRWIRGVNVTVRNPIGAGDAFVGGLVHALGRGEDTLSAVVRGLATASASCEQERAGGVDPARAEELSAEYAALTGTA